MSKLIKVFFVLFSVFLEQNTQAQEIELRILKDTIVNNSLIQVEFYNNSETAYYFPFDTSMDRHLKNNSVFKDKIGTPTQGKFSLREVYLNEEKNACSQVRSEETECLSKQYFTSYIVANNEWKSVNVDLLFLQPKRSVKIYLPIQFVKEEYYHCFKFYAECPSLVRFLQFTYHILEADMKRLKELNMNSNLITKYNDLKFGDINYELYTKEIKSNIVPIKK